MRICCFMVWIWMGMIVSVYAQDDHLSPMDNSEYMMKEYPEWFKGQETSKAHYVCAPSWGLPAYGFYLKKEGGKNYLVKWREEDKQVRRKQVQIPEMLAREIELLFAAVCRQIDYPEYVCFGVDLNYYYFSTLDDLGRLNAGWCRFTTPQPRNKKLVEICNALSDLPEDTDAQLQLRRKMQLLQQSVRQYAVKWKNHSKVYKSLGWGPSALDNKSYRKEWDKAAEFPGMNPTDYVIQNMVYPAGMLEKNSWAMILAQLELDAMGYIAEVSLLGMSSRSSEMAEEVIRVIYSMPPWIPAKKSGKPVCSVYRFAVPFNPVAYRERMGLK